MSALTRIASTTISKSAYRCPDPGRKGVKSRNRCERRGVLGPCALLCLALTTILMSGSSSLAFCLRSTTTTTTTTTTKTTARRAGSVLLGRTTALCSRRTDSETRTESRQQKYQEQPDSAAAPAPASSPLSRRKLVTATLAAMGTTTSAFLPTRPSHAYDKAYPIELVAPSKDEGDNDSRSRKVEAIRTQEKKRQSDAGFLAETPAISSLVWAGALWFLSGSRSNPIATPLANVLYKKDQETWLQDRNDGLFGKLPWEFLIILGVVFVALGFWTDYVTTNILAEGDRTISLQLAGVSVIAGCSLELGRIASGEKRQTREEFDRSFELQNEFVEFADQRLVPGGNCHRAEVVQAFRRFHAKYRQAESEEYPLTDIEIEQLLRSYCRARGVKMSSAGFYLGIKINQEADVFVKS